MAFLSTVTTTALANHPVLVEGEEDFDGDGRIGVAEDNDGNDGVFGTINAALAAANGGANQNGEVIIVTSGRFPEIIFIQPTTGNVTLEAAPGVMADIDAVLLGNSGNAFRQGAPGIIVNAPATSRVVLRNLLSRNWTVGVFAMGESRVTLENCRLEGNTNQGILAMNNAQVAIHKCEVNANGFRTAAAPVTSPAFPGAGIQFVDGSSGIVSDSTVTFNRAAGISRNSTGAVTLRNNTLFGNVPDQAGTFTLGQ